MKQKQITDFCVINKKRLKVNQKITSGLSSTVFIADSGHVIKKYKKGRIKNDGCFERECFWLERLQSSGIVPKLVDIDYDNRLILMEDAGVPILNTRVPTDWRRQLEHILDTLEKANCKHNDISELELLVHDGVTKLIDFGYASIDNDMTCGGLFPEIEKNRTFDDKYIINLIDLLSGYKYRNSEPHCFVLWCFEDRDIVETRIAEQFTIIQAITYYPKAFRAMGSSRLHVLDKFYQGRTVSHGSKGYEPFVVYIALDESPEYGIRSNLYSNYESLVNTKTYELKKLLRKNRSSYFHGSDSIQESYDNLESLTFNLHRVPVCYWDAWRPKFRSLTDFLENLNSSVGLEYVVLRNFEKFPEQAIYDNHPDIDILVNNYYLFKRVVGGIGYKHKLLVSNKSSGPAYEYGGYKVANKVSIGGQELTVDVRFIGDNYYDDQWERNILRNRVRRKCFFIPDSKNLFYSLLYHALVHKRSLSSDYRERIYKMAYEKCNIEIDKTSDSDKELWTILDVFMEAEGYQFVRPMELNIPFNARERAGIRIDTDLSEAKNMFVSGNYREAGHLLHQVLADEPNNDIANRLLAKTERKLNTVISAETLIRRIKVFLRRYRVFRYIRNKFK